MLNTTKSKHIVSKSAQTCHSLETQFSVVKKLFRSDQEIFYDCIKIFSCLYGHPHPYTRNILLTLTQVLLRRVRKTEKYQITTEQFMKSAERDKIKMKIKHHL